MRILRLIKSLFVKRKHKMIASTRSRSKNERMWKGDDGLLNRINGPAVEKDNGEKRWYRDGNLIRDGGPTIEYLDGILRWPAPIPNGWDRFTYGYSKMELYD